MIPSTQSQIGVLAAMIEGFEPATIARAYAVPEIEVRRQASICFEDVLKEFGLKLAFTSKFGGVQASYSDFADWIEKVRGVPWVSVLKEHEAIEAIEIIQYVAAFSAWEKYNPRAKFSIVKPTSCALLK